MSIAKVPKGILNKIKKKCSSFLGIGKRTKEGIPLVKWSRIVAPKVLGGWV